MAPAVPADELLLGFTHALRVAGLPVTPDRSRTFLRAVACLGLAEPRAVSRAGQATLCSSPADLALFDAVFRAWFSPGGHSGAFEPDVPPAGSARVAGPSSAVPAGSPALLPSAEDGDRPPSGEPASEDPLQAVAASDLELLRHRDVARLEAAERVVLTRMLALLRPRAPRRTSYRRGPAARGVVDPRRTLRLALAGTGEPLRIARRRRRSRPRRTVLLVDVSGSMSDYADALLRLAHRIAQAAGPAEVFSVGTRVTRLTAALRPRDPERALAAAGAAVPDWSGGTRLGETLQVFLDRWGRGGLARGAVVVIFSDGWERGDAGLLRDQMERLHRLAHRVVWVNPHKASAGYRPVQQGMAAALPSVDAFVAGHSLAAFEELLEVVARA